MAFSSTPPTGTPTLRVPFLPFTSGGTVFNYNFRIDATSRFGPVASADYLNGGVGVLSQGTWVLARNSSNRPFTGSCFVWRDAFACNDGTSIALSNDIVATLPPTSQRVVNAHVWPQSATAWVADRTTEDNNTTRFEVRSDGTVRQLPGAFYQIAAVVFAGAPAGELFVMLRRSDAINSVDTEVYDGTQWVRRGVSLRADLSR